MTNRKLTNSALSCLATWLATWLKQRAVPRLFSPHLSLPCLTLPHTHTYSHTEALSHSLSLSRQCIRPRGARAKPFAQSWPNFERSRRDPPSDSDVAGDAAPTPAVSAAQQSGTNERPSERTQSHILGQVRAQPKSKSARERATSPLHLLLPLLAPCNRRAASSFESNETDLFNIPSRYRRLCTCVYLYL